jgi:hypothetical protein
VREFLEKPVGKIAAVALVIVAAGIATWVAISQGGATSAGKLSADRMFIDTATGKPFEYTLKPGDMLPVLAPSGQKTGYQAEACYWTKDGQIKSEPTYVAVNARMGKPGPTFCPDCGRLVTLHNPVPSPGAKPPPTKEEYEQRQGGSAAAQNP